MKMTAQTRNFTKKDVFNAASGAAVSLQEKVGEVINVRAAALGTDHSTDAEGDVATGYLVTSDGEMISCISPTALKTIDSVINMDNEEEILPIDIKVALRDNKGKSRKFITLEWV